VEQPCSLILLLTRLLGGRKLDCCDLALLVLLHPCFRSASGSRPARADRAVLLDDLHLIGGDHDG